MRQTWILALGAAMVVAMSGCARDEGEPGGGGGNRLETHDDSNPVTREERSGEALKQVPTDTSAQAPTDRDGLTNVESKPIARGGQPLLKVNVNTASVEELTQVPGISADLAQAIVANRPYQDAQDLSDKIPSLKPNSVASFEQYLVFGGGGAGTGGQ